jgi:hypothetical protein
LFSDVDAGFPVGTFYVICKHFQPKVYGRVRKIFLRSRAAICFMFPSVGTREMSLNKVSACGVFFREKARVVVSGPEKYLA